MCPQCLIGDERRGAQERGGEEKGERGWEEERRKLRLALCGIGWQL